jgi:predicted nucleotidyltransferase
MGRVSRVREGDFVESKDDWIFDVKGLIHPPDGITAYVRYVPDERGDRIRRGVKYRKIYDLSKRYDFLRKHRPQYLRYDRVLDAWLNCVPVNDVAHVYKPLQKTRRLLNSTHMDAVETQALDFIKLLNEGTKISLKHFGISGSVLVGLHSTQSDIDLVVYGRENSVAVRAALKKLLQEKEAVTPYGREGLRRRYDERQSSTPVSFNDYVFHEARKTFQGFFEGREFFIRYVKEWREVTEQYGDTVYRDAGYATVKGRVVDASEGLFTPCTYTLTDVDVMAGEPALVTEVSSFRGRFCDQAARDEWIVARGKLERVTTEEQTYYRLLLGGNLGDYMVALHERRAELEQRIP